MVFTFISYLDLFQRVFETQLLSSNQKLSPLTGESVGSHQICARALARANYVSYLSFNCIFTISRGFGRSRMGHYNQNMFLILYRLILVLYFSIGQKHISEKNSHALVCVRVNLHYRT